MKFQGSVQWDPSSMGTGGQTHRRNTDITKLIVGFRNFTQAPKMNHRVSKYIVLARIHVGGGGRGG
jgi:hypothetical protein